MYSNSYSYHCVKFKFIIWRSAHYSQEVKHFILLNSDGRIKKLHCCLVYTLFTTKVVIKTAAFMYICIYLFIWRIALPLMKDTDYVSGFIDGEQTAVFCNSKYNILWKKCLCITKQHKQHTHTCNSLTTTHKYDTDRPTKTHIQIFTGKQRVIVL